MERRMIAEKILKRWKERSVGGRWRELTKGIEMKMLEKKKDEMVIEIE